MRMVCDDSKLKYNHWIPWTLYALDNSSEEKVNNINVRIDAKIYPSYMPTDASGMTRILPQKKEDISRIAS